ncbi:MAG: hypothetical protein J6V08_02935 [Candidatus Methanomethylophilaceae archaeon]|nr:hypothetical protein [Candidatus Methanomethylophilaceae archaeon]
MNNLCGNCYWFSDVTVETCERDHFPVKRITQACQFFDPKDETSYSIRARTREEVLSNNAEYVVELEPVALQKDNELCLMAKSVRKLVRCKDCKWMDNRPHEHYCTMLQCSGFDAEFFCGYGEKE